MYGNAATVPSRPDRLLSPGSAYRALSGMRKNASPDRLTRESDNPTPCLMDAQGTASTVSIDTWTVPDEWNAEMGEGGTLMGYREPTDSNAPPTETATEPQWTPEPGSDGDDSGCNVATNSTGDESEYMQTIADTLHTELDEQMQTGPETPNTETDEASGLVGEEAPDYRDETSPSSLTEDQDSTSPTGRTNDGNSDPATGLLP